MSVVWEWVGEGEIEREIGTALLLSANPASYAGGYDYDETEPIETETFVALNMGSAELEALRALARQRNYVHTITDKLGAEHTGRIRNLRWKNKDGLARWEVTLTLKLPQSDPDS